MEASTPVFRDIIQHPAAWTSESLGEDPKARFAYRLRPEHFDAFDALLERVGSRPLEEIVRDDRADPGLAALMGEIEAIIANEAGAAVIQGITRERYSEAQFEKIFWAMGTYLGSATIQNAKGDRISHVTQDKDHPTERGYRGSGELSPHTDAYAILGLMCVQRAQSGGFSHLSSALAIHNEVFRTHPEMLDVMYRGTRYASMDARGTTVGATPENVPLFSCVDGQVSCFFSRQNSTEAVRQTGVPMDPAFAQAADYFEKLSRDPRFRVEFMLDPGEIMVVNNYVLVHARTEFEDSAQYKRDLLRLWLNNEGMRKVMPQLHLFAKIYDDIFKLAAAKEATETLASR